MFLPIFDKMETHIKYHVRFDNLLTRITGPDWRPHLYFSSLLNQYEERGRAYHIFEHIIACLQEFDEISSFVMEPDALELAIWFHDAIYHRWWNTGKSEEDSLMFMLKMIGPSTPSLSKIIVRETKIGTRPTYEECKYMQDIDLSIWGKNWETFKEYRKNIRKEYWFIPKATFRKKEIAFFRPFLQNRIYNTPYFQMMYEVNATNNIKKLIMEGCVTNERKRKSLL